MNEREIFETAINIPDGQERQAYLDRTCGDDAVMRDRIEKLVHAHHAASGFLETPAAEQLSPNETNATVQLPTSHADADHPAHDGTLDFLQPGTKPDSLGRLAHYEVLEVLGRGAFGIVLKAFDDKLHRMVAIKVMNPELAATSPPRKRFLREAQSSARVRHENIVAIHAVEEQPSPYLVMEYIPGGTLQQRLDLKGPLEIADILRLGQQIAAGLAAAHAQGLIHRDIKPANILIESGVEERVKITDFGLARATDDASLTQSGLIAGTPLYMAPEQAKGQPLDHRTDLFSLGSVLYTMASGRPPFRAANTIAVLKRVCEDTPRPITEVIPETPQWLCDIISKLHAKEPDDRFQSAKEVADVLGQHLAFIREPMRAPRPAPIDLPVELATVETAKVRRPVKANGWTPTAVALAIIAGVLLIPVVGLVLVVLAIAIPAYQAANARIPVLPDVVGQHGLRFDGKDDYVKVEGLDWSYPQFTLEAFVNSANDGDNGVIAMLYSRGDKPEAMFLFDGPASTQQRMSGAGVVGQKPFGNAMAPLTTGVRQHRALVFDGQVLNYYVNGVWQGKRYNEAKEGLQWEIDNLLIGCKSTDTEFFRGVIDQVRVSRVARYTQNFPPVTNLQADDTTLALYNFDEGSGDVLHDSSVNNHHARIFGATWITGVSRPVPFQEEQWISLFNGQNLQNWELNSHWHVEQGMLVSRVRNDLQTNPPMLVTNRKDFRDFHARAEIKINRGGDSGLFFRFGEQGDKALQAQITAEPTGIGSLLRETTTVAKSLLTIPPETWTTVEVIAQGPQITVLVGGQEAVRWTDPSGEIFSGPLAFESGFAGTEIAVRKVEVKRLSPLSAPSSANTPALAIAPFDAAQAKAHQEAWAKHLGVPVEFTNNIGMKFRLIPPGEFLMGSVPAEITKLSRELDQAGADEFDKFAARTSGPQHRVRITQPFYLGEHEVSIGQYRQFIEDKKYVPTMKQLRVKRFQWEDSAIEPRAEERAVIGVSWDDAQAFCAWVSEKHRLSTTLPTEAQWEYACRAGTTTLWSFGDDVAELDQYAVYGRESFWPAEVIGSKKPNPFGLFDLHGNADEWCRDWHNSLYYAESTTDDPVMLANPEDKNSGRVARGGTAHSVPWWTRSTTRTWDFPATPNNPKGFRVSMPVDTVKAALAERAPPPAIAPFDAAAAKAHQQAWAKHLGVPVEYTNSLGMKFRLIPPGEFTMGSTPEEIAAALKEVGEDKHWQECIQSEAPQHKVILTQPIYLGVNEVTQAEYEKVMGSNPSHFAPMGMGKEAVAGMETAEHPVEMVSWNDAAEFCAKLSQQEKLKPFYFRASETITPLDGTGYRLPSEAEWEFACGAGTTSKYWIGDQDEDLVRAGWIRTNSDGRTHAAGELKANPFGLYDIYGNVWEWVQDGWDPSSYGQFQDNPAINPNSPFPASSHRVIRGGCWYNAASRCRSSRRFAHAPTRRVDGVGFRVSLAVDAVRQAISLSTTKNTPPSTADTIAPEKNYSIRLAPGVHVEMPSLKLDPNLPYTIEAWVTPLDANHADKHVAGWSGPLSLFVSHAELNWSFGLSRNGAPFQFLLSPTPAAVDRRIHLAAVRTGWEFRLFVDGQRVGNSQEHSATLMEQQKPFSLSSSSHPFSGDYDEVRVSRVARYNENFTPQVRLSPDADTLALYHCDENGGEQLVDASGHQHHGKIVGKATWTGFGKAAAIGNAPPPAIAPFDAAAAKAHQEGWAKHLGVPVETTNSIGAKMVLIPPGEFLMGAPDADADATPQEKPQHRVRLTKPFAIGATEVTNGQFRQFVEATKYVTEAESDGQGAYDISPQARERTNTWNHPELKSRGGDEHPVRCVSWQDAQQFCKWLTQTEGHTYRLPSEAEWEFACRAGTVTRYSFGNDLFDTPSPPGSSGAPLRAVAQLPANPFGLFDMHGNVNEICWDSGRNFTAEVVTDPLGSRETDVPAVVRGGAVSSNPIRLRSSNRFLNDARRFPETNFATMIKGFRVVQEISPPPPMAQAPFDDRQARAHQEAWAMHLGVPVEYTNSLGMKFRLIPPGEFTMGSTPEEIEAALRDVAIGDKIWQECILSEAPQHKVILSQPIYFGMNEVTQSEYEAVMGKHDSYFAPMGLGQAKVAGQETTLHPVDRVSWNDAAEFCVKLSMTERLQPLYARAGDTVTQLGGNGYRLPSEAQWEFACRAGTTHWFGDQSVDLLRTGWFQGNSQQRTHLVGQLRANAFGLSDMHGNVWEWVQDGWDASYYGQFQEQPAVDPLGRSSGGSHRVIRGGCWGDPASACRAAGRRTRGATALERFIGFRVALPVDAVRAALAERKPSEDMPTNSALEFNGVDSLAQAPDVKWDGVTPLTMEAYVTPRAQAGGPTLMQFRSPGHGRIFLHEDRWASVTVVDKIGPGRISQSPFQPGVRVHVASVWDGKELTLFVNGVPQPIDGFAVEIRPQSQGTPLLIGAERARAGHFAGLLDEIRISKSARYRGPFTPKPRFETDDDTLALYHCDEGQGTVLKDSSGHGLHATVSGAKWIRVSPAVATIAPGPAAVLLPSQLIVSADYEWSPPEPIGPGVNTSQREVTPTVTDDELLLVFSRNRQFWECRRDSKSGPFGSPRLLPGEFPQPTEGDLSGSLSGDGLLLAFSAQLPDEKDENIFLTRRSSREEPFGPFVKLPEGINTPGLERNPKLSPDSLTLAFTINRPDLPPGGIVFHTRPNREADFDPQPRMEAAIRGDGWDTLECFSPDGLGVLRSTLKDKQTTLSWHPRNRTDQPYGEGRPLQPPFDRLAIQQVQMSADGQTLYFHSREVPGGEGNLDLWVSRRLKRTIVPQDTPVDALQPNNASK